MPLRSSEAGSATASLSEACAHPAVLSGVVPRRDVAASITSTWIHLPYVFSKEWVLILETSDNSHSETFHV